MRKRGRVRLKRRGRIEVRERVGGRWRVDLR